MSNSFGSPSDYAPLLKGDHGFLLAIALTVLVILILSFFTKIHFTWRRFAAISRDGRFTCYEVLAADAFWLIAHLVGFAYLGVRIATLHGFTEGRRGLSRPQRLALGREDQTAHVLFMVTLYLSCCSVICTDLAIRNVSRGAPSPFKSATYFAPLGVFIAGILLCTLPLIGCNGQYMLQHGHHRCRLAPARIFPPMIVLILLDTAVVIHWASFAYRRSSLFSVQQVTRREPWPVVPFLLRLLIVGANIAYLVFYTRATGLDSDEPRHRHHHGVPYHSVFYPELLALLMSLSATTSVSMSKILAKFNFAGIAYADNPTVRSRDLTGPSGSRTLTSQTQRSLRRSPSGNGTLLAPEPNAWPPTSSSDPSMLNPPGTGERKGSDYSDLDLLPHEDNFNRKPSEVSQAWDTRSDWHDDHRHEDV